MFARRVIAVSPQPALGDQLAVALRAAGGSVDLHRSLGPLGDAELGAALWVIHFEGEVAQAARSVLPRLTGACRVIAVLPRASLALLVEIMQVSDRVIGMVIAEDFDARALSTLAAGALTSDVFGLERIMLGAQIHTAVVGDYPEKTQCMSQIAELVERAGVPRRHHASIEQCVDEMLMNALYDAPVDAHGRSLFGETTTRTRTALRTEQTVSVQYAYDGKRFAVAVRDAFGSLPREVVLGVLYKCLHAAQQIDRKASGAGVGLYLMVNSASSVTFNVVPGVATEVVCTFDVGQPVLALAQLGLFIEQVDVSGRLAAGRRAAVVRAANPELSVASAVAAVKAASARGASARRGTAVIVAVSIGAVALVGLGVWQRLSARPAPPALPEVVTPAAPAPATVATVELDSQPPGATVEIAGKSVGETPISLTTLAPGSDVVVVFDRAGYRKVSAHVTVPALGKQARVVQPLTESDDVVRVHVVSTPPGAQVVREGQATAAADRTYTPADVFVEPGKVQRFTLIMPGHAPLVIPPFTPERGGGPLEKGGPLPPAP